MSKGDAPRDAVPGGKAAGSGLPLAAGRALLVALAMTSIAGVALGDTYKWVDDKGVVHYTDKMPPDQVNKAATSTDVHT